MGSALLRQWAAATGETAGGENHFTVIDPQADPAESGDCVTIVNHAAELGSASFDMLIVAVKPQVVDAVLPAYAQHLAPGGIVASIAAGCSIERLGKLVAGAPVVRIMPNLPVAIGMGVSGLCAGAGVDGKQRDAVQRLMEATGRTLWVEDEDKLDRLTAISGSGPGYFFEIARSMVAAAEELGFNTFEARRLVLGTMSGTAAMAFEADEGLAALRDSVTSKNGTTEAGLNALNADKGLDERLRATVNAAYERAVELR